MAAFPIIDISAFNRPEASVTERAAIARGIGDACETIGDRCADRRGLRIL
jgi:hypothetical protein